jgi:hypothetical protein
VVAGATYPMTELIEAIRAIRWTDSQAVAPDGRKVGDVVGLVVDRQTGRPQWLLLHHRFHGHRCVPLTGVIGREGRVHVPYDAATILHSEPVPEDGALSARHEQNLCAAYGLAPTRGAGLSKWERRRTTALARLAADGGVEWEPGPRAPLKHAVPAADHPEATTLRVLIADADTAAGQALATVIQHHPRMQLAGLHRDGPQTITAAIRDPPDVLVLCDRMMLLSGMQVRDRLHAALPSVVSVILDDTVGPVARALDDRTVRAPRSLGPAQLVRVIEVLAMTQSARSGSSPLAAHHVPVRGPATPTAG